MNPEAISKRNSARVRKKQIPLEPVTSGAEIQQVRVVTLKIRPQRLRLEVIDVHPSAHVPPDLAVETIDAAKCELVAQPRTILLIVVPAARTVAADVRCGRIAASMKMRQEVLCG